MGTRTVRPESRHGPPVPPAGAIREAGIFPVPSEGALRATLGILDGTVRARATLD
jgi:hypothetical protein